MTHAAAIEAAARAWVLAMHGMRWEDMPDTGKADAIANVRGIVRVFLLQCEASEGMEIAGATSASPFNYRSCWRAMARRAAEELK